MRLKKNIRVANLSLCENIVRNLDLSRFTWNDDFNPTVEDRSQLGFIAQEVEKFLPKSIVTQNYADIPDCKLLDATQISMVMYGVLKRSITRIDELETQIDELKGILARNNLQ